MNKITKVTRINDTQLLVETDMYMSDLTLLKGVCVLSDNGLVPAPCKRGEIRIGPGIRAKITFEMRTALEHLKVGQFWEAQ